MPIQSASPVTIPPVEAKTLPYIWIRECVIRTPSPLHLDQATATAEYGPWSGDMTQDAVWRDAQLNDLAKRVHIANLYDFADAVPSMKVAMAAVRQAIADAINYQIEQERIRLEEEMAKKETSEPVAP